MALIDQRILIDAPAAIVWDYLTDPEKLTRWHTGYAGVSILTTHRTGEGMRRRCALTGGGKDTIEEITAWVDGLGYEYVIVEGGSYRTFQARIRLQPVPDGTSVQWTVEYARKGMLCALKDRLAGRRQLAGMMADSLRQLKRQIDQLGVQLDDDYRARVGMRERLNAEERAQYQRRYAPPPGLDPTGEAAAAPPAAPGEQAPAGADPSFVAHLTDDDGDPDFSHEADTEPRKPKGLDEAITAQQADHTPESTTEQPALAPSSEAAEDSGAEEAAPPVPPPAIIAPPQAPPIPPTPRQIRVEPPTPAVRDDKQPTPPHGIPVVKPEFAETSTSPPTPAHAMPPVRSDSDTYPSDAARDEQAALERFKRPREAGGPPPARDEVAAHEPDRIPPQTPETDTGELSIWDVFGVQRPSEEDTQTLTELVQTVRAREAAEQRRRGGPGKHQSRIRVRARRYETARGLRGRLARRVVRVQRRGLFE